MFILTERVSGEAEIKCKYEICHLVEEAQYTLKDVWVFLQLWVICPMEV